MSIEVPLDSCLLTSPLDRCLFITRIIATHIGYCMLHASCQTMMPSYLNLFAVLATGNSSLALNNCIPYCSSIRSLTPRSLVILSVGRERRVTSPSKSSQQQQQLIDKEEAARIKRIGQAKHRLEQSVRRENRITVLESSIDILSSSEKAELDGLLIARDNLEEQYDVSSFTSEHVEFKRLHNEAFVALARYCHQDRYERGYIDDSTTEKLNVFYLDGPDCGSTNSLIDSGFDPSQCYVANRHESTCKILQEVLPEENVVCATASEALSPPSDFSCIDFSAYYFDGCGGYVPHIIQMMSSALIRLDDDNQQPSRSIAVGFSLMGGNKDIVEKELEISRALSIIANTRGMRTRHVLDDPIRYGIPNEICKTEGGTFTSWILLEAE